MNFIQQSLLLSAAALSTQYAIAQGIVAGWDFADVPNIVGTNVDGYEAEITSFNNGVLTEGSISSSLTQGTQVYFAAGGNQAAQPGFNDGFDQISSSGFDGLSGQQHLTLKGGAAFGIVFNFSDAYNVVINADWLTSTTAGATDILDISYSSDGGVTWTSYNKADSKYVALSSTAGWVQSTGNAGGFLGFVSSQSDMVIDLSSVTPNENTTINAVRFEFVNLSANERVGLDNVHIAGTAVEASTGGGSLFILDNTASTLLDGSWYRTPMGDLQTAHSPWIWSNDYGWIFSPENNTESTAYVYINAAPFQTWVFVDQSSATAQGFWGYAYDAAVPALNGWFWFFNTASTNNVGSYFIWDDDGAQALTFDDQYQP